MNRFASALASQENKTLTENGAKTYKSSLSSVLDLFASGGAFRTRDEKSIELAVGKAFAEDPELTLKTLFYLRDVRGGQGERRTFRIGMRFLATQDSEVVKANLRHVPTYVRFDDLVNFLGTPVEQSVLGVLAEQFVKDCKALKSGADISLLAKWLPSENTSSKTTRKNAAVVRAAFGCNYLS